ncbi:MAG: type II secretion system secretin GspD [Verrucomicrobiia bacterium]
MRKLRLSLFIVVVSTWLAILTGTRPRGLAFAEDGTNTVSQTNTEQEVDTGETEEAATPTNALPKQPLDVLHPQSNVPPAAQRQASAQPPSVPPSPTAAATPAPPPPHTPPPPPPAQPAEQAVIDFEFQGASINAILDWYSRLTGRSIISAPNLNAQITFRSQSKLTRGEAIQALDSVLAINNIAAIPLGEKFLKVVQITTAKQEGLPVGRVVAPADTLGTQIIPLKNAKASEVVPVLQPYLHPYGQLMALQDSNSILISETAANLKQMMEIVAYVDQPSALRIEMRSYVLKHAKAGDVMARLQSIIQEAEQAGAHAAAPGQPGVPPSPVRRPGQPSQAAVGSEESVVEGKVIMAADDRTNKLFILTRVSNFGFFDRLIAELDAKVEPDVVMKVILLNYATAEDVAGLLNALITGGSAPSSASTSRRTTSSTGTTSTGARAPSVPPPPMSGGGGGGAGVLNTGFLQYAEGVHILPDPRTNSLLVMATKEDMARIQELVKSIDTSVAQVQIECVIAELTLNNELDVGVDMFSRLWRAGEASGTGGNSTDGNTPVQLSPLSAIGSNLPTAAALAGGAGGLTYFTTFRNLNLDTVLHALATTSNSKVLSTPIIQTMDNQEADITVGESVPVPTSQTSSLISGIGTLATAGVTSSIQYEDVAIELTVTPRINPDGYVRMDIEQKVNDLGANVNIGGTIVPTILKREAKSSLAVQDKSTIVLGGLIQQTKSVTTTKTPFLGDIPFFGQLFKSQTNNRQRTELIIFIRPTVMRTDLKAVAEAKRRLRMLGVSEELEETYFPKGSSGTNNAALPPKDFIGSMSPAQPNQAESPRNDSIGSMAPNQPNQAPPPPRSDSNGSTAPAQSSEAQPTTDYSSDRQTAKVKALKLQDGDITTQ